MPNAITTGSPNLTFQGNKFSYNPREGFNLGYSWSGPFSKAAQVIVSLIKARTPFSFEQNGAMATISILGNTAISGTGVAGTSDEVPVDRWDLRGNEVQYDIMLHPNSLAIENIAPGALKQIKYDVDNGNLTGVATTRTDANGKTITVTLPISSPQSGYVIALKSQLSTGQDHFDAAAPVLRHTYTVSDAYTGTAFNFANPEAIYTTAQLLAECAAFPFPLPAPYVAAINSIPARAASGYTFGWKKSPPDGNTAARYKNEVVTEYRCDLWDTAFRYKLFTP